MKIMELRLSCTLTMSGGARSRLVAIALGAVGDAGGIDTMLVCARSLSLSRGCAFANAVACSWHGRICASRNYVLRAH